MKTIFQGINFVLILKIHRKASHNEEEVNLLRQEVSNLTARLQMAGSPRRESHGTPQLQASPYDAAYQREIQELKARLEESERWNASLQARLNELQSRDRADGVWNSPSKVQRLEQV